MKRTGLKLLLVVLTVLAVAAGTIFLASENGRQKTVWVVPVEGVVAPYADTGPAESPLQPKKNGTIDETQRTDLAGATASPKPEESKPVQGAPRIAIIIDDVGIDVPNSKRAIGLPPAVTLSFLPNTPRLAELTSLARAAGHEMLLHMPMEPIGNEKPGEGALLTNLPPEENRARLLKALDSFSGYDGVNNHMGSKFTASREGMAVVADVLAEKRFFFFDSLTTPKSAAGEVMRERRVPTAARDVFLDNNTSSAAVKARLAEAEKIAQSKGQAVAIGHPHPTLVQALEKWIPEAEKKGFKIVPVRDLVR
jgi:uncharacterized protein